MTIAAAGEGRAGAPRRLTLPPLSGWLVAAGVIALGVVAPIAALAWFAAQGSGDLWPHLVDTVLPQAIRDTAILLFGVGALVIVLGTGTAWLVTAYDFPGRSVLDWALLLPLAIPTYIVAYTYLDVLHPIGPVQTAIRALFAISNPRDLPFPDVRSMWGCILLLSLVLYPYVYLSTRAMFLMQAASLVEVARTLGHGRRRVFFHVALPLARPAIVVGTSLALMEALNDIGASEFLGVRTLTVSIYATWINRSSLPGAAQIALVMLALVISLILIERWARRRQRYAAAAQQARRLVPQRLAGARGLGALAVGFLPVLFGFCVPALHLAHEAYKRVSFAGISPGILEETINTVTMAAVATAVTIALGLVVAYTARIVQRREANVLARLASVGYAIPGTVLAIGLLTPLAAFDNAVDGAMRSLFGISTGLILSGSGVALVYAYVVRFLAIANGGIEAGLSKVPHSLDHAARALGQGRLGTMFGVHLPLVRPALLGAALLVFVDCMKELPATLLLRPLNFETLATHLYAEASRGTYEDGAVAALLIVVFGLVPVILLARMSRGRYAVSLRASSSEVDRPASFRP
ncbi:iron ABC transporter permease [Chelatococcus daeguensis]|uniref:Iron ABC transporter permease n=1 Tax=Chelatococcus daeguensis TaxID=444444 RepID=A0AAC9JPF8_9HYPH|nr:MULTISPECIES: iron ABC transporter permease [Chelatococcus]APF37229.1 iron ABC transporter permease [Chelatococcus daeguensis]MBM3085114.1 iron ABC transporter permease [Chelatococcus daeguensis]